MKHAPASEFPCPRKRRARHSCECGRSAPRYRTQRGRLILCGHLIHFSVMHYGGKEPWISCWAPSARNQHECEENFEPAIWHLLDRIEGGP